MNRPTWNWILTIPFLTNCVVKSVKNTDDTFVTLESNHRKYAGIETVPAKTVSCNWVLTFMIPPNLPIIPCTQAEAMIVTNLRAARGRPQSSETVLNFTRKQWFWLWKWPCPDLVASSKTCYIKQVKVLSTVFTSPRLRVSFRERLTANRSTLGLSRHSNSGTIPPPPPLGSRARIMKINKQNKEKEKNIKHLKVLQHPNTLALGLATPKKNSQ